MNNVSAGHWLELLDKQGYVQVKDFLPKQQANVLRQSILKANHFKMWRLLTTPYYPLTRVKDRLSSPRTIKARLQQADKAARAGQFAFSFYRSSNKHAKRHNVAHIHQSFVKFLNDALISDSDIHGKVNDSFVAKFQHNQFISYHTDGSAGKYAFIYQLSKGWQKKYGGQLVLYPPKGRFYKTVLEPEFNCLTLLKLSHPMPHSVTRLKNPPHKHRLTISGWLE